MQISEEIIQKVELLIFLSSNLECFNFLPLHCHTNLMAFFKSNKNIEIQLRNHLFPMISLKHAFVAGLNFMVRYCHVLNPAGLLAT